MGKRFIDTDLCEKDWYMNLSSVEKAAFMHILMKVDSVGVCRVNKKLYTVMLGEEFDWDSLPDKTNGNIEVLPDGKWFLVDYCNFQYGGLKESNSKHSGHISKAKSHGILDRVSIPYLYPMHRVQDKDKDKEEDKDNIYINNKDIKNKLSTREEENKKSVEPEKEKKEEVGEDKNKPRRFSMMNQKQKKEVVLKYMDENQDAVDVMDSFIETLDDDSNLVPDTWDLKYEWLKTARWCIDRLDKNGGHGTDKVKDIIEFFRIHHDAQSNGGFSWRQNFQSLMKLKSRNSDRVYYVDYFWEKIKEDVEYE